MELWPPAASLFRLPQSGEVLVNVKEHSRQINDIQLSRDMTMFVTASKDNTAKVSLGKESGGAAPTPCRAFGLARLALRKTITDFLALSSLSSSLTLQLLNTRRLSGQNVRSTQLPSLPTMTM